MKYSQTMITFLFIGLLSCHGCIQGMGPDQPIIWNRLNPVSNEWSQIKVNCESKSEPGKLVEISLIDKARLAELKKYFILREHHGMSMSKQRPRDPIWLEYSSGKHVELFFYDPNRLNRMWFAGEGHEAILEIDEQFHGKIKEVIDPEGIYRFDSLDWGN